MTKQQSSRFQQAYRQLNPLQKQAVDHIGQGPLLVVAGPGTGKTQVLSLRIANILLKTDVRPDNILALTFTDVAAKNMRKRLVEIVGKEAYYLQIHTFHSFCQQIMTLHPEYFPIKNDSQVIDDLELHQIIEQLLDQLKPETLRPLNKSYFYTKAIIQAISNLKREGIDPLEFEQILQAEAQQLNNLRAAKASKTQLRQAEKRLAKNQDLLLIYTEYQKQLQERARYDFDDMINFVTSAFSQYPDLLLSVQEQLQYFLVDEYQDSNSAQNQLLNLLASYWPAQGLEPDLFVVGDPNQAIYRFQGASVENVLAFTRQYPSATIITLDTAYRCPQNIYDSASQLIEHNQLSKIDDRELKLNLALRLQSQNQEQRQIIWHQAQSSTLECIYIVETIQKLLDRGVAPQEIAVLYRTHAEANQLLEILDKWQITYQLNQGDDILQMPIIEQILQVMQVIAQISEAGELDNLYQLMLYPFLGLDELLVLKLGRAAGSLAKAERQDISIYQLYQRGLKLTNQQLPGQEISDSDWHQVTDFFQKLNHLAISAAQLTLTAWFEQLISEQGFNILHYIEQSPDRINSLLALNTFFSKIKALVSNQHDLTLKQLLNYLATYQEHQLKIRLKNPLVVEEAVQLSTVHGAKGMEWQHVFLFDFVDGKWGNPRKPALIKLPDSILQNTDLAKKERNEDERRLFYVALTRTKEQLYLSYPEVIDSQASEEAKVPSLFLSELPQEHISQVNAAPNSQQTADYLNQLLAPGTAREIKTDEKAFFQYLLKDWALSVTALNSYLADPKRFVTNNLLRLPQAKSLALCFGSAVHGALEKFYRFYQQSGVYPDLSVLLQAFDQALDQEILSQSDFTDRLKYGRTVLSAYYQHLIEQPVQVLDVERNYASAGRKIMLGDIRLTGKIDRLDWLDQSRGLVKVVDYKTGRVRSLNDILAKTQTAQKRLSERELNLPETIRGAYQRQLVFYRLLLDLDRSTQPALKMAEAEFAFIEPTVKGGDKFVEQAVDDLKQLIKAVMKEIRSLAFLADWEF